jgi:hypothetical protein
MVLIQGIVSYLSTLLLNDEFPIVQMLLNYIDKHIELMFAVRSDPKKKVCLFQEMQKNLRNMLSADNVKQTLNLRITSLNV